jgi:hypothetical protein
MSRNDQGVFTFTADDRTEVIDALKEIFAMPLGKDYVKNYRVKELEDEHLEKILGAAQTLAGGERITVQDMERGLQLLMSSGAIIPTAALRMSTTVFAVRELCRSGQLNFVPIGHKWLISLSAIQDFIRTKGQAA